MAKQTKTTKQAKGKATKQTSTPSRPGTHTEPAHVRGRLADELNRLADDPRFTPAERATLATMAGMWGRTVEGEG